VSLGRNTMSGAKANLGRNRLFGGGGEIGVSEGERSRPCHQEGTINLQVNANWGRLIRPDLDALGAEPSDH